MNVHCTTHSPSTTRGDCLADLISRFAYCTGMMHGALQEHNTNFSIA